MKRLGIFKKGVIINVLALTMYYGMEIWLIPVTTVLNVNNPFSAEMLIRMLGFATGLFIAVVGSWLIYHAAKSLNDKRLYTVFLIQVAALFNSADYLSCSDSDGKGNPSCTVPDQGDGTGY